MQSDLLDVIIGVVFVWFLLSLVLSAVHEGFSLLTHARAKHLWLGIGRLFNPATGLVPSKLLDVAWRLPFRGSLDLRPRATAPEALTGSGDVASTDVGAVGRGIQRVDTWATNRPEQATAGDPVKQQARAHNQGLYDRLAPQITEVAAQGRLSKVTQILPAAYSAAVLEVAQSVYSADVRASAIELHWSAAQRSWLDAKLEPVGASRLTADQVESFAEADDAGPVTINDLRALWTEAGARLSARDVADFFAANPALQKAIRRAASAVGVDQRVAATRAVVERWFEREMDQLSRFYRRQSRKILLILAIPLVLLTHANSISLFSDLRSDASLRQATLSAATAAAVGDIESFCAPDGSSTTTTIAGGGEDPIAAAGAEFACARDVIDRATAFRFGLAWQDLKSTRGATGADADLAPEDVLPYLGNALADDWGFLGRAITLFALMFGAQFWFDLLRRLVGFRKLLKGEGDSSAAG